MLRSKVVRRIVPVLAALVLVSGSLSAHPTHAAPPAPTPPAGAVALSPAPSDFRHQLEEFDRQLATVAASRPGVDQSYHLGAKAAESAQAVTALTEQQLAELYHALSGVPNWQSIPAALAQVTGPKSASAAYVTGQNCPPGFPGSPGSLIALDAINAAFDIAGSIIPDGIAAGLIVLGEGAVITIPDPVLIVLKVLQATATVVAFAAHSVQLVHDLCVADDHNRVLDDLVTAGDANFTAIQNLATSNFTNIQNLANSNTTDIKLQATNNFNAIQSLATSNFTAIQNLATSNTTDIKLQATSNFTAIQNLATNNATAIKNQVTAVQTTLDTKIEQRQVQVSAVTVPGGRILLISASESGLPVPASLVSLKVATAPGSAPIAFTDATASVTATLLPSNVLQIQFPDTQPATTIYQVVVKDDGLSDVAGVTHYGTLLVSQKGS